MTRNNRTVKFFARQLLGHVPRTREISPRDLINMSRDFYDFIDHPRMDCPTIRMAAHQLLSVRTDNERRIECPTPYRPPPN